MTHQQRMKKIELETLRMEVNLKKAQLWTLRRRFREDRETLKFELEMLRMRRAELRGTTV